MIRQALEKSGIFGSGHFGPHFAACPVNTCRIYGVFCTSKLLSRYRQRHRPHTDANYCLARSQPIRTVVYPHVLNRQRQAARQLLFVEHNARAGDFHPRLLKINCHCVHYGLTSQWGRGPICPPQKKCSTLDAGCFCRYEWAYRVQNSLYFNANVSVVL
jgi:hypothetical protein